MKLQEKDLKKIKSKIRRDEFVVLKSERNLSTIRYNNPKVYNRKKKHLNI